MSDHRHHRVLVLLDISSPPESYHGSGEIVEGTLRIAHLLQVVQQCKTSLIYQVVSSSCGTANAISYALNAFHNQRRGVTCESLSIPSDI